MQRLALALMLVALPFTVHSESIGDKLRKALGGKDSTSGAVTQDDAASGIKEALASGVERAVNQLGQTDGFFKDQAVKILVPKKARKIADLARKVGAGQQVDAFELSMNRAAEKAVPEAASILGDAVRGMTMEDAMALVRGGDTAATDFFRRTSEQKLHDAFLPIVAKQTENTGVTQRYKAMTGSVSGHALGEALTGGSSKSVNLDNYVTDKAIDGLFEVIAAQEAEIRSNPAARTTSLLRKVFGK